MAGEERQQHITTLKAFVPVCLTKDEQQAVNAAVAALEREAEEDEADALAAEESIAEMEAGQQKAILWEEIKERMAAHPSPDLESVRRLERTIMRDYDNGGCLVEGTLLHDGFMALPELRSLLVEIEKQGAQLAQERARGTDALSMAADPIEDLARRDAVIAAMREALRIGAHYTDCYDFRFPRSGAKGEVDKMYALYAETADTAQLAADHDAAIRAKGYDAGRAAEKAAQQAAYWADAKMPKAIVKEEG